MKNLHKDIRPLLKFVVQKEFMPKYAPSVTCFIFKSRGKTAKGKPQDFTEADKEAIVKGLMKMARDVESKWEKEKALIASKEN
jgi:hypothetical protein